MNCEIRKWSKGRSSEGGHMSFHRLRAYAIVLATLASVVAVPSQAGILGPSTYDECITESMKGVTSDLAASVIINSCRKRFPSKSISRPSDRDLSPTELENMTGRAGLSYGNDYSGTLYNGNNKTTVTTVTIAVTTKIQGKRVTHQYSTSMFLPPLRAGSFRFMVVIGDPGADYSWSVVSARGY